MCVYRIIVTDALPTTLISLFLWFSQFLVASEHWFRIRSLRSLLENLLSPHWLLLAPEYVHHIVLGRNFFYPTQRHPFSSEVLSLFFYFISFLLDYLFRVLIPIASESLLTFTTARFVFYWITYYMDYGLNFCIGSLSLSFSPFFFCLYKCEPLVRLVCIHDGFIELCKDLTWETKEIICLLNIVIIMPWYIPRRLSLL